MVSTLGACVSSGPKNRKLVCNTDRGGAGRGWLCDRLVFWESFTVVQECAGAGGCKLRWRGTDYQLKEPEIVDKERAWGAFPGALKLLYQGLNVDEFVLLHKVK